MTVRDALREGAAALAGSETPFLDASLLLAGSLGADRARLLASGPDTLDEEALARFRLGLASRGRGLPVAYILGYKEFWGRRFAVDGRVLVPRPETETLVAAALKLGDSILREREERAYDDHNTEEEEATEITEGDDQRKMIGICALSSRYPSSPCPPHLRDLRVESCGSHSRLRVHEVCAGSGCVAISLAADRPGWVVSASDLSEAALAVAAANAASVLGGDRRPGGELSLRRSDLLSSIGEGYGLIVANPPYVPSAETESLLGRGWSEPRMALDGGPDGMSLIRRLLPEAERALAPGGAFLMEADAGQAGAVAELFRASRFIDVETICDLGGRPRVTAGRKPWTT